MTHQSTHLVNTTLKATSIAPDGAADDVQATIIAPDDTTTTYTLSVDSELSAIEAGRRYQVQFYVDQVGTWTVRWDNLDSGDTSVGSDEEVITVVATTT